MLRITLAAALLLGLAGTAQAQWIEELDTWEQQVQRQLYMHRARMDLENMTHKVTYGSLDEGENEVLRVDLESGEEYTLLAVCDNDCTDIDLEIFDDDGDSVDSDYLVDDYPIVSVSPRRDQTYRLHVSMASCSVEPCRFAVAVFSGR